MRLPNATLNLNQIWSECRGKLSAQDNASIADALQSVDILPTGPLLFNVECGKQLLKMLREKNIRPE